MSGFCKTHNRQMSELRFKQCHDEPGYFEVFQKPPVRNAPGRMRGLGDLIAKVADFTGISRLIGKNCGCRKRQDKLNKLVPFGKKE